MTNRYIVHQKAWDDVDVQERGEGAIWRSVVTGDTEIHRIELRADARTDVPVQPGTWTIQVLEGRVTVLLMGNELMFDRERYAIIPPNVGFSIVAEGRRGALVWLVHCRAGCS